MRARIALVVVAAVAILSACSSAGSQGRIVERPIVCGSTVPQGMLVTELATKPLVMIRLTQWAPTAGPSEDSYDYTAATDVHGADGTHYDTVPVGILHSITPKVRDALSGSGVVYVAGWLAPDTGSPSFVTDEYLIAAHGAAVDGDLHFLGRCSSEAATSIAKLAADMSYPSASSLFDFLSQSTISQATRFRIRQLSDQSAPIPTTTS